MKILLLDDLKYNLVHLKHVLTQLGHDVKATTCPNEALEWLKKDNKYDAVFSDFDMPEMNGLEFQQRCRQELRIEMGKELPAFVMLSAYKEPRLEREASKKGFLSVIGKPYDRDELLNAIERVKKGEHQRFNEIKHLLCVAPSDDYFQFVEQALPQGQYTLQNYKSIEDAIRFYHSTLSISAVFCAKQLNKDLDAIGFFEVCAKIERFDDSGNYPMPPFYILLDEEVREKKKEISYIDKALKIGIKDIIMINNPVKLRRTLGQADEMGQSINSNSYKKVLVVDDIAFNRSYIQCLLKKKGIEVVQAECGDEALHAYRTDPDISLVMCDWYLGDMSANELYRRCQAQKRIGQKGEVPHAPFILITASRNPSIFEEIMQLGFLMGLHKPIDAAQLLEATQALFDIT